MGRKLKPEEAKERWQARAAAFGTAHGASFRDSMSAIWNLDKTELDRRVYGQAKPTKRSGNLRGYERMRLLSSSAAVITNTATSVWKGTTTFYAHIVAKGTKARDKGRKYYLWMDDPRDERVSDSGLSWENILQLVARGYVHIAHRLKAVPPRNWRQAAMALARSRGIMASYWRKANKKVHDA